jgi:hypothetical protein
VQPQRQGCVVLFACLGASAVLSGSRLKGLNMPRPGRGLLNSADGLSDCERPRWRAWARVRAAGLAAR